MVTYLGKWHKWRTVLSMRMEAERGPDFEFFYRIGPFGPGPWSTHKNQ